MKKTLIPVVVGMILGTVAVADDANRSVESSTDTTRNPITGSTTTTAKYRKQVQGADGREHSVDVTEKTKIQRDGTVEKSVDSDKVDAPPQGE